MGIHICKYRSFQSWFLHVKPNDCRKSDVLSLLLSSLEEVASFHEMSVIFTISAFEMHRNLTMVAKPTDAHEVYESIL